MIWYVSALCFMIGFVIGKAYVKYSEEMVNRPEGCEMQVIRAYSPSSAQVEWNEVRRMIEAAGFEVDIVDIKPDVSNEWGQNKYIYYYKKTKIKKGAK